jgi:hypothetical protein
MGMSSPWVLFSAVHGTVLKDGRPVQGAELVEKAEWSGKDRENPIQRTVTDEQGAFSFPVMERKRGFLHGVLPTQPAVVQTIVIQYQGFTYNAWLHTKLDYEANTESGGLPLVLNCELTRKQGTQIGICKVR